MKKIYALTGALLLTMAIIAQEQVRPLHKNIVGIKEDSFIKNNLLYRQIDTTGIVNVSDYLPEFYPTGSGGIYYYEWDYGMNYGGYFFGNNRDGWNVWAQGYLNLAPIPTKVIGALIWFRKKESDLTSNSGSVIKVGAHSMLPNSACNTDGSGVYNGTNKNALGPASITPVTSGNIAFSAIDTINPGNYVAFSSPAMFTGDFAISVDTRTLVAGDTVGILADDFTTNDGKDLDCNYVLSNASGGRWIVIDQWGSDETAPVLGTGQFDLNLAIFAVLGEAWGVDEFFNGMKLSTYPNPSVDNATIEYTLEKNSSRVRLTLYNGKGGMLVDNMYGTQAAGTYKVEIDTKSLATGTYFYQLRSNGRDITKQFIVTK